MGCVCEGVSILSASGALPERGFRLMSSAVDHDRRFRPSGAEFSLSSSLSAGSRRWRPSSGSELGSEQGLIVIRHLVPTEYPFNPPS